MNLSRGEVAALLGFVAFLLAWPNTAGVIKKFLS